MGYATISDTKAVLLRPGIYSAIRFPAAPHKLRQIRDKLPSETIYSVLQNFL
jgi:hypothetical protein